MYDQEIYRSFAVWAVRVGSKTSSLAKIIHWLRKINRKLIKVTRSFLQALSMSKVLGV